MPVIICTTGSGNDYSHYATTLLYLQDVNQLPQFYKDVLANQAELNMNNRIPQALQNAPPQRDLELHPNLTSDKWIPNTVGLFTFVSGVERTLPTKICSNGRLLDTRRFGNKTVLPHRAYMNDLKSNFRRSCASCMFNSNMTRCDARR